MNKERKAILIFFIALYTVILGCMVTCLITGNYALLIFFGVPALFLVPIFETFYRVPKNLMYHVFLMVLLIISRLLLATLALLIPALVWYFVESIHESVNSFFLLIPFFEIIIIYVMIMILFFLKGRQADKTRKKDEL